MTSATEKRPPVQVVRHAAHSFTHESGTAPVQAWCLGDYPSYDCPVYNRLWQEWLEKKKIAEEDRLHSLGFRSPLQILQHEPHTYQLSTSDPIRCKGTSPNKDCPIAIGLDRAYREGRWQAAEDPYSERYEGGHPDGDACGSPHEEEPVELRFRTLREIADWLYKETGRPVEGFHDQAEAAGPNPDYSPEEDLVGWWKATAQADIEGSIDKVREYGGCDLLMLGTSLYQWAKEGKDWSGDPTPAFLQELGIWFYLQGKIGRALSALQAGKFPSDDTILDIVYYAMMIRRIRTTGGWPG